MKAAFFTFAIPLLVVINLITGAYSKLTLDDHARLDGEQLKILNQLKERVHPKMKEDFMKDDLFILPFLQARKFDLEKAELMLLNHLQWRDENELEAKSDEDWSELEKEFPYELEGEDRQGRPLLLMDFAKWNIAEWNSDPVKQKRLMRHFNRMLIRAQEKIREQQGKGKNVTQFMGILDLEKVELMKHMSFQSASYYYKIGKIIEDNFPMSSSKYMYLNSPTVFHQIVVPLVRQVISEETNNLLTEYPDKASWKPVLDQLVDPSQLPPQYGGTKRKRGIGEKLLAGSYQKTKDGWILVRN